LAAVAGLADAGGVLGVVEGDLDGPAGGVAYDDAGDRGGQVGGHERDGRLSGFGDDQDPYRSGAEHTAP
jgi:hypothetical protein